MSLYVVEMRRSLHRRVVWVLVALALVGCVAIGVVALVDSAGRSLAELHANGQRHPAVMRDWWISGTADGATATFAVEGIVDGTYLVRIQVDGAESPLHVDIATGRFDDPKVVIP